MVELTGDDAVAHVAGACVGDGDFHHDDTVFVTHDAERCESRQVFKKVLRNGATGVFQGKILVKPGAQKTDGYQISQSLLLDERQPVPRQARAGDLRRRRAVLARLDLAARSTRRRCSTCARAGCRAAEAEDLLVLAFLAEAIEEIEDEALAAEVLERLEGWLARRRGLDGGRRPTSSRTYRGPRAGDAPA